MSHDRSRHWEEMYRREGAHAPSWFESIPRHSLQLIRATGVPNDAPILDIGGGASHLVDHLLAAGYTDLSVLDIAPAAMALARARLGTAGDRVEWIAADVRHFQPSRLYALWHDRAALHFLVTPEDQRRYMQVLVAALAPRGHVILATFGPEGPSRCSGLPVRRYSAGELGATLGTGFQLKQSELTEHDTPTGHRQRFLFGWWQAVA